MLNTASHARRQSSDGQCGHQRLARHPLARLTGRARAENHATAVNRVATTQAVELEASGSLGLGFVASGVVDDVVAVPSGVGLPTAAHIARAVELFTAGFGGSLSFVGVAASAVRGRCAISRVPATANCDGKSRGAHRVSPVLPLPVLAGHEQNYRRMALSSKLPFVGPMALRALSPNAEFSGARAAG